MGSERQQERQIVVNGSGVVLVQRVEAESPANGRSSQRQCSRWVVIISSGMVVVDAHGLMQRVEADSLAHKGSAWWDMVALAWGQRGSQSVRLWSMAVA